MSMLCVMGWGWGHSVRGSGFEVSVFSTYRLMSGRFFAIKILNWK